MWATNIIFDSYVDNGEETLWSLRNQKYWCVWTERIENKATEKAWTKWEWWGAV